MPYSLVFLYSDGTKGEIKPIACDNPKSPHQFEDRSILRKATLLAKKLSDNDCKCHVEHYQC